MRALALVAMLAMTTLAGCSTPAADVAPAPEPGHPLRASDFTWAPAFPRVGEEVAFQPSIKSAIAGDSLQGILWRIEGLAYRDHHPVHAFAAHGVQEVSMTVMTAKAEPYTVTHDLEVLAPPAAPAPKDPPAHNPPAPAPDPVDPPRILVQQAEHEVAFAFTWDLAADQVHWDFGDGASSDRDRPAHAYHATGLFEVSLRVASGGTVGKASTSVNVTSIPFQPRVVVGMTDTGINPYHMTYYRPEATRHPCEYVKGYDDCSVQALPLTVGPAGGSYQERLQKDDEIWRGVQTMTWYWIPQTNIIAVHCPSPYDGGRCILDDTQTHGTQTTSSMLSEAPEALLVFNEGSGSQYLASAPVPIDIESNSWGSLAPLYAGFTHAVGISVCHDSIDSPYSIKLRSAGNNGPVPNMGDCWRNGYRSYSVAGGYPSGQHGYASGSAPDFASYWCRPAADPQHVTRMVDSICGTSFAAPTAAGTVAAALLEIRRELGYVGGSDENEVAPGISHEELMDAVAQGATYSPTPRPGFPSSSLLAYPIQPTPWLYWGWGWLHAEQAQPIVECAMGRTCIDNKSSQAWTFNDVRRGFAADS